MPCGTKPKKMEEKAKPKKEAAKKKK